MLFDADEMRQRDAQSVSAYLRRVHYLGPANRAQIVLEAPAGVLVFGRPASRHLPAGWLELSRWAIEGARNEGSKMWARASEWLRANTDATTVVSYSDPAQGHDGALYRACNWLWAPTWQRLRPPPTGHGRWTDGGRVESVKDRWVFPLRPDAEREACLAVKDDALVRRMPWAAYREPRWTRRGTFRPATGGGDFARWRAEHG